MATSPVKVLNPDPLRLLDFVKRNISFNNNIRLVKNTVILEPNSLSDAKDIQKYLLDRLNNYYRNTKFKEFKDGNLYKIKVIQGGYGSIHIIGVVKPNSPLLRPGIAFEEYFTSVIIDHISALRQARAELSETYIRNKMPYLTLLINTGEKVFPIGPIKSVDRVGGKNKKTDVLITKNNGTKHKISLKQSNFSFWSSADTYNSKYSIRAKNILKKAIENKTVNVSPTGEIIFPNDVKGIRTKVDDDDEIKYYAFGSISDRVDSIIINGKFLTFDENKFILTIGSSESYRYNNTSDFNRLKRDFYMVIQHKIGRSSGALSPYKNVSVQYVNSNHAFSKIDGKEYIDI